MASAVPAGRQSATAAGLALRPACPPASLAVPEQTGAGFLCGYGLPNFPHLKMGHAVLRLAGAPPGKRDVDGFPASPDGARF
jgi:hypothetical protein